MARAAILICGMAVAVSALGAEPEVPQRPAKSAPVGTALIGGGDCKDAELVGYLRSFAEKLRPRFGSGMVELNATASRLRPSPNVNADEIARQLEAALSHFYSAEFKKAESLLETAMRDVVQLPNGDRRTRLQTDAWLLRMMLTREQRQAKESEEAMVQILRLRPDYKLDPVYYAPSVRADFEQVRKRMKKLPRAELSVRSSPSGADVFLDGARVGKSPVKLALPHGSYTLQVVKGEVASFMKSVELRAPVQVLVDLDFEGAVTTQPVPCIHEQNDEALLTKSVRLGSMVDVEQVVILAVERPAAGPSWLTATLVSVERGQKARQAGFKARGDASAEAALADLAEFIATGQATGNVVVAQAGAGDTPAPVASAAPWSPPAPRLAPEAGPPPAWTTGPRRTLLLVGAGAALVGFAGAGTLRLVAQPEIDELNGRLTPDGRIVTGDARSEALVAALQAKGTVITGLLILGGAGVGAGAAAMLWPQQPQPVAVTVIPTPTAWAVSVTGSF